MRLRRAAPLLLLLATCNGDPGSAPQPFSPEIPANGAVAIAATTGFQWSKSIRADTYTIDIATDTGFGTPLYSVAGLTDHVYTPPAPLPTSTTIYWRVRAFNVKGDIGSGIVNFNSEGPPGAFSLATPADTATGVSSLPTYSWTASAVADTYTLDVAYDAAFTSMVFSQPGITITASTPPVPLAPATPYYWRVTAINAFGNVVATGAPFSFTTS